MARRWTKEEEEEKRRQIAILYWGYDKTIAEIGELLEIAESTVYDRMKRLDIPTDPNKKGSCTRRRQDITVPESSSVDLAELVGVLLGDGGISETQVRITLCKEEVSYSKYLCNFIEELLSVEPGSFKRPEYNSLEIYVGSVDLVEYLKDMGFVSNKVEEQVSVPDWVYSKADFKQAFLRGFFDTDGSIYSLKHGVQMSFSNGSSPLLQATREFLIDLRYHPSKISKDRTVYITRKEDLYKYKKEIGFGNEKHLKRAEKFGIV